MELADAARAAYSAAEDLMDDHRTTCFTCGNSRVRHPLYCPEGQVLKEAALAKRRVWAAAVARVRDGD
jgi:hypothetical protein